MKAPSLDALEDKVLMGTNYFKMAARLLAPCSKNVFQMRDNRQFRQLMGTIDKVKSHIEGLLGDMIFYIACNERIRSGAMASSMKSAPLPPTTATLKTGSSPPAKVTWAAPN